MASLANLFNRKSGLPLDFHGLMRLATWGTAAGTALLIAVLSAHSQRATMAAAASGTEGATPAAWAGAAMMAQLTARSNELEGEAKRLADAVSELTADRDRLIGRIATLERSLEDVTGTVKRPTTAAAPAPTPPAPAAPPPVAAAAAAPQSPPSSAVHASLFAPAPLASRDQVTPNVDATDQTPRKVAALEATDGKPLDLKPPEIGVDVGGAGSFDAARTLWHSTKAVEPAMFEGLRPQVVVRETKARGTELRLMVGPFANQDAATRLCVALSVERRYCQPMPFEGQELSLAAAEPQPERRASPTQRRPAPTPQRTSATRPKS